MRLKLPLRRNDHRARGVFLVEMIVVIAIMGAVALIAGDAMVMSLKLQKDAFAYDTRVHRLDDAIDRMQRDVWASRMIRAADGKLELETAAGTIAWQSTGDGNLVRRQTGGTELPQSWTELPVMHFSLVSGGRGAGLVTVTVDQSERGEQSEAVTLTSQVLMAGGGT